tara:strand:+ start:130 stop:255 length:126 start_codon:yes stop_codon:yes gene_type:complete
MWWDLLQDFLMCGGILDQFEEIFLHYSLTAQINQKWPLPLP